MSNLKYFLAGVLIMAITSCMQKDSELFLFVGSYADATDPGINLFRFDVEKGTAVPVKSLSGIQDPSYLTVSRDGKFVYSVSETAVPDAKVCAYSFDKQTGTLSLLNEQHTDGSAPCLSAINAKNQQIAKQTPSFTPKNVKLGVFVLFKIYPSIVSLWTKK